MEIRHCLLSQIADPRERGEDTVGKPWGVPRPSVRRVDVQLQLSAVSATSAEQLLESGHAVGSVPYALGVLRPVLAPCHPL